MKIYKSFNVFLFLLMSITLPVVNLNASGFINSLTKFGSNHKLPITGGFLCLTTTLAILELYKNNVKQKELLKVLGNNKNLSQELEKNKMELSKVMDHGKVIQAELDSYKSDAEQLAQFEKIISTSVAYKKILEQTFSQEFLELSAASETSDNNLLESLSIIVVDRIKKEYGSISNYQEAVNKELSELLTISEQLALRNLQWKGMDKASSLIEQSTALLKDMNFLINNLKNLLIFCQKQKYFIEVIPMLEKDFENAYVIEIQAVQNSNIDLSNFDKVIDKHVLSLYSNAECHFPYLCYAQKIKEDKVILDKAINNLSELNLAEFQKEFLNRVQSLKHVLDTIFEYVVTSEKYKEEKSYKPEFDRKEAQLRMELEERAAKIEQEKKLAQAKLLNEKNKNQELENEKARIEKDRKEIELKNNQISLEIARQNVKEALDQNDRRWSLQVNDLQSKLSWSKSELESSRRDNHRISLRFEEAKNDANAAKRDLDRLRKNYDNAQSELDEKKRENNKLKYENEDLRAKNKVLENNGSGKETEKLKKDMQKLKNEISNATQHVRDLEIAVSNPPFNPEIVDGLGDYINRLKNKVNDVKTALPNK